MNMLKSFSKLPLYFVLFTLLVWQLPAVAEQSTSVDSTADIQAIMPVNINTASVQELADGLNGVGEKRAQAIVDYRQQHGVFSSAEQLTEVKGIGEAVLNKNRAVIVVE